MIKSNNSSPSSRGVQKASPRGGLVGVVLLLFLLCACSQVIQQRSADETKKAVADSLIECSYALFDSCQFQEAILVGQEALKAYQAIDDSASQSDCYSHMTFCHQRLGDVESGIEQTLKGLHLDSLRNDRARMGSDYNNLTWQALTGEMPEAYGQYSGGYESGDLGTIPAGDTVTPAGMCGGDGAYSAYPNIGGADQANPEYGWHRIGFRVHQEVTNADAVKGGAAATYKVTITAYFDGVKAFALSGSVKAQNLLYTATSDGEGGITYADGASDRYVYAFRIQEIAANDDVYIPIGEVSVTCGTEFVQKVEKVASPAAKDYEVEAGVILPGAFYYRLAD